MDRRPWLIVNLVSPPPPPLSLIALLNPVPARLNVHGASSSEFAADSEDGGERRGREEGEGGGGGRSYQFYARVNASDRGGEEEKAKTIPS